MTEKVVLTYGTFDLFHIGHLNLLRRLRQLGDRLLVGVSTDDFCRLKGKQPIMSFPDRADIVRSLRCVDGVFAEECWEQKVQDIHQHGISVFGMGNDWQGRFDELKTHCEVVYLPRTEGVSSTEIRNALKVLDQAHVRELKQALDLVSSIVGRLD